MWILCKFTKEISNPSLIKHFLSAHAEADSKLCFRSDLRLGVSHNTAPLPYYTFAIVNANYVNYWSAHITFDFAWKITAKALSSNALSFYILNYVYENKFFAQIEDF